MKKRKTATRTTEGKRGERSRKPTAAALDRLIEEAVVDAHDVSEQMYGFLTMIQDNLSVPFVTEVLGVTVSVDDVDMTDREEIVAVVSRGGKKQKIPILDLPLPSPPPKGYECIEAYRRWTGGGAAGSGEEE